MTQNEPQAPEPISLQEQPNQETMQDGEHKRVNDILLGFLERPALNYLAKHMPAWVWPDTLTAIGVVGSAIVLVGYILAGFGELKGNWFLHLSSLGFVINWFGDSLDGTLARYRHIERPRYGFFMDHSIDGFSACAMILGIGLSGMSTFEMATFALIGYLLSMIVTYLKTHATGVFEMTAMRVGPTEARVLAIFFNTWVFFFGNPRTGITQIGPKVLDEPLSVGTIVMFVIGVILVVYYISLSLSTGRKLALADERRLAKRKAKEARRAEKALRKAEKAARKERERQMRVEMSAPPSGEDNQV